MTNKAGRLFEFGPFQLDVGERVLRRGNEAIPLTPKVFDLLVLLVENPGRLLEKEALLKSLWPDTFVEEANLSVNVSALRKALGETPNEPQYIETVPKRGYRFLASVKEATFELPTQPKPALIVPPSRRWALYLAAACAIAIAVATGLYLNSLKNTSGVADIRSIAVLPFKPLISDANGDDNYLGLGMADALIARLTNIHQITVRPTSSIQKYCTMNPDPVAAGKELQVEALLEGRIQRSNNNIRVTVQLLRVRDGAPLWADKFDDSFTNIFAVQDSISEKLANALSMHLSSGEQKSMSRRETRNSEAYELYLQGQYLASKRTRVDTERATEYFVKAIAKDPGYALPYADMAAAYITRAGAGLGADLWEKARVAARKAVDLDGTLAEAHLALGKVSMRADWDWDGARREFDRALAIDSKFAAAHSAKSTLENAFARHEEAIREMELACRFDPASAGNRSDLAWTLYCARKYDDAIAQSRKALDMDTTSDVAHRQLEKEYLAKHLFAQAKSEYDQTESPSREATSGSIADLGLIYAVQGRRDDARGILEQLKAKPPPEVSNYEFVMAKLYAALGEKNLAFELLAKACEKHLARAIWMRVDPDLDPLRSDPRFNQLLSRVRLLP
jgi:DNA-binding winged helix-turn-helix (wHTH) protein/TolB-like protein/Flp pilus assembly protein TadD